MCVRGEDMYRLFCMGGSITLVFTVHTHTHTHAGGAYLD